MRPPRWHALLQKNFMAPTCLQVATQSALPGLKQTLKLYTSISLPKLAALMEQDQAAVRSQLMTLKASPHRSLLPVVLTADSCQTCPRRTCAVATPANF